MLARARIERDRMTVTLQEHFSLNSDSFWQLRVTAKENYHFCGKKFFYQHCRSIVFFGYHMMP